MTEIFSITLEQKGGRRGSQVCLIQAAWSPLIPNDWVANHCALCFHFRHITGLISLMKMRWNGDILYQTILMLKAYCSDLFSVSSKDLEPLCPQEHLNTQKLSKLRGYIITKVKCAIETVVAVSCKDTSEQIPLPFPTKYFGGAFITGQ